MQKNLFQSKVWGEFQAQLPSRGKYWLITTKGGEAMVVRHTLPFGLCWLSVERGPLLKEGAAFDELLVKIKDLARKEKAVYLRIEPPLGLELTGGRKAHAHYQPEWTLRVDLEPAKEEILAQMKQKGRYNIRVAEKNGVTIQESTDVNSFYKILEKTGNRDGFHIHPQSYYEKFVAAAEEGDFGKLYLAEHEGQVVAGILVTFYGDTGTYYYGASDHEKRSLMAPYLLQWKAIKESKKRGLKWYDLLGIAPPNNPNHPWKGITQFKKKFGGEVFEYPKAREYVYKPFWYLLMRLKKSF